MRIKKKTIDQLKAGNEVAFDEVYYTYYKLIYYIIYSIINDQHLAEDLMQEAFIKMYKNIHQLNNYDKFHQWFIKLTKNLVFNYLKSQKQESSLNLELFENYPDTSFELNPPKFEFNQILTDLENYIVTLHIVYNLTFKEIADETNKSMSVVTKAYYKALKKLKKSILGGKDD